MKFVDELKIYAKAGDGGDGVVRWEASRGNPKGGPAGGDGGRGGDVYVRGIKDTNRLSKYTGNPKFLAENAGNGMKNSLEGKNGEDMYVEIPVGSLVTNTETDKSFEILKEGEEIKILTGGRGGFGNEHFKSSRNVSPQFFTEGKEGEEGYFRIELQLMADAGFIGLPSAGKSSLINEVTNAHARVGAYPFTTLDPNLGELYGYILADIPGLIEGASDGKGLGIKFLKHIKRTKTLIHCISVEQDSISEARDTIINELKKFDEVLLERQEIIVLTKTDLISSEELKDKIKEAKQTNKKVLTVSIIDDESLKVFKDTLIKVLRTSE